MRVYSNFQKDIISAIYKHYKAGTPQKIKGEVAKIAEKFQKSFDIAENFQKEIELQLRDEFAEKYTDPDRYRISKLSDKLGRDILKNAQKAVRKGIANDETAEEIATKIKRSTRIEKRNARTLARTVEMGTVRGHRVRKELENGCRHFKYSQGPRSSMIPPRDFCRRHTGHIYSIDEIDGMNNGQGLPVLFYMGGYNCLHFWEPIYGERDKESGVFIGEDWKRKHESTSKNARDVMNTEKRVAGLYKQHVDKEAEVLLTLKKDKTADFVDVLINDVPTEIKNLTTPDPVEVIKKINKQQQAKNKVVCLQYHPNMEKRLKVIEEFLEAHKNITLTLLIEKDKRIIDIRRFNYDV